MKGFGGTLLSMSLLVVSCHMNNGEGANALKRGRPGGPVKYDFVHMLDQAFSKQPLNEFCSLPKNDP